jgi:hypothetical protein
MSSFDVHIQVAGSMEPILKTILKLVRYNQQTCFTLGATPVYLPLFCIDDFLVYSYIHLANIVILAYLLK